MKRIEENHSFNLHIATAFNHVNKAILLKEIYGWIFINKAKEHNFRKGHYWTFMSARGFANKFPYMNKKSIARWLKQLCDDGWLYATDQFNKKDYDRTLWYTINHKRYDDLVAGVEHTPEQIKQWLEGIILAISQNEDTRIKMSQPPYQNEPPIPSTTYPSTSSSTKKREKTAQKKSTETKTETPPHSDYDFYYQQELKKREDAGKKEKVAPKRKKYIVPMMAAVYGKRFESEFGEPYEANDSHKNAFRKIAEKIKSRLCKQGKPHDTQAITDFFSGMVAKMDSKFVQSKNFYPKFINSDFPNLVVSLGRKPKNTNRISDWYEGIGENKEDLPW